MLCYHNNYLKKYIYYNIKMTKLEQLQEKIEELTVKLHRYQDKSIEDEEIKDNLKEENRKLKQEMTKLELIISTNINKIQKFNQKQPP